MPAVLARPTDGGARRDYLGAWQDALAPVLREPSTLVLRDFHVDNLMRLLEDARRDVSPALKADILARYRSGVDVADWGDFEQAFTVLAAQRHAKVIGIFTRLCRRDGKRGYLMHIPRVWRLLEGSLANKALTPVARWLDRHLPRQARVAPPPAEPR
jgi:aminoglycoside/choline kinase family phosphotransferase